MYTGDKRMGYRPGADATGSNIRDKAYPSEVARQRPALTTRIHCSEYDNEVPENSLRGGHFAEEKASMSTPYMPEPRRVFRLEGDTPWDDLRAGMRDKAHGNR